MRNVLIAIGAGILIIGGLVAIIVLNPIQQEAVTPMAAETPSTETPPAEDTPLSTGRYVAYSSSAVGEGTYTDTIIFFHAPWCPECRAFEKAIEAADIPAGVQILKADYDSSSELKKKYGVTLQSTFVKVDKNGDKVSLWVGYGKEKSLDLILEQT